jgi:hypothetical protein
VRVFAGCLREEEPGDALDEVYPLVKAGLERFQLQLKRMQRRMRPGAN